MNFEELQRSWQTQPLAMPEANVEKRNELTTQWERQQRKVKRGNTFTTVAFAVVFVDMAWVYSSFHHKYTWLFGGSLLLMVLVMLVYLWVMWKGYAYNKRHADLSSKDYIHYSIETLQWRRKTRTTYGWIYALLLWAAFMLYCADVTKGGTLTLRVVVPSCITVYIFGMTLLMRYTRQKKQIREIDELIASMQQLKDNL